MPNKFSAQLIKATFVLLSAQKAYAALPRHCFIVTELHGTMEIDQKGKLVSDLPTLMAMFYPEMRINSVTAMKYSGFSMKYPDQDGEFLEALSLTLYDPLFEEYLNLTKIGDDSDNWKETKIDITEPLEKLTILWDEFGICDVRFYAGIAGIKEWNLLDDTSNCKPGFEGIEEFSLSMTKELPLVGFHGRIDEDF